MDGGSGNEGRLRRSGRLPDGGPVQAANTVPDRP